RKYTSSIGQRLGFLPDFTQDDRKVVWLHCVSVGETNAARPLVKELRKSYPDYRLVVSTTTLTGQTIAKDAFRNDADLIFYFPFDWRFSVRRALRIIKPSIVLLMETELWFNFIRETRKSGANVIIVNGRLSEKSANRYGRIKKTMRRVLHHVDLALMQTQTDGKRLVNLGIRSSKIKVVGNMKFDQDFDETESKLTQQLKERFGISNDSPLIVAASTHEPEENWILESFKTVYKNSTNKLPRLLIAPRHPERFDEVAQLIEKTGFSWTRRTAEQSAEDELVDVILLDSIGELRAVYPLAEIVFVGGSLIPHGGQSILEPAIAKKAIITGFYTMNFAEIVKVFLEKDALIQMPKLKEKDISDQLSEIFLELLQNDKRRHFLGEHAFAIMRTSRGSTIKTIEELRPFFKVQNIDIKSLNRVIQK
ncbi:MAG: 3-deoxy-D-manno-octulosonic acid transferase, partial [Pyrinomonadaceae bacterium]|nr:3-deoxy-D-manno-octulosonic acid transferase [Pyrinomonadaceae bacterium]